MKFLICGIGSIGQRHYKNLKKLGHDLAIYRFRKTTTPFLEKFLKEQKDAGNDVKTFYDMKEALKVFNPDAVFVTNPNSSHMETALLSAKDKRHLFIEKPITDNLRGVKKLQELVKKNSLKVMVGYNLRYHPLLKKMKEFFDAGEIGEFLSARVEMGENMEDWHPWEDYRTTYAPYKSGGGGVTLCFSHDIDYLYWFLGKPKKVFSVGGKISPLEGDAEDVIDSLWEFKGKKMASIHLDYWQRPPRRIFELVGTKGRMNWDYYAKTLTVFSRKPGGEAKVFKVPEGFDRNDMFIEEVKDFIGAIKNNKEPSIPLGSGIDVLKITMDMKKKIGF